jgi:hypothetical protein
LHWFPENCEGCWCCASCMLKEANMEWIHVDQDRDQCLAVNPCIPSHVDNWLSRWATSSFSGKPQLYGVC